MKMKIETPVAFGLTLTVCLVLLFYCWRIRKFRHRLTGSVQVSALPLTDSAVPVEEQRGIKKEVIATFPTVKVHELKDDVKEGCPICLVEYTDAEVLRKLPRCNHVFHTRCVEAWLENQVTCPVCRIVLTDESSNPKEPRHSRSSVTVEVPAWVLVNRPMPLPPAIATNPSPAHDAATESHTSIDVGITPLLHHSADHGSADHASTDHSSTSAGWGAVYLENQSGMQSGIQTKECINHASISERWMTESFVFGISSSGSDDLDSAGLPSTSSSKPSFSDSSSRKRHDSSWSSRSVNSTSCDLNQQPSHWLMDWEPDDVLESRVTPFKPLTMSPERCSFEFLPVVTVDCASARSPRTAWVGPGRHTLYSQL